GGYAGAS
nr:Chain A, GGYAGAS segment 52-58 from the low complexity domain of Keratin-8 [Homo sapiens]7K3Y_B Chain B, GGYAGAS segment 52-58 from the low complexity domain of Keratin-8 [Homo sapiens]